MPRPKNGYTNAAGQPIPGVHDVTGRYGDKNGLIQWAYKQGCAGVPLYEKGTLDIGTVVHHMCELDLRGASQRDIDAVPHEMLSTPGDIDKAWLAFRAFLKWRTEHNVRAIAFEEALVCEEWQYGGTFDCIAWVDGVRSLIDFKTCKTAGQVYLEQRVVMAAHGALWHKCHPDLPLAGYHLINLPKDGSPPGHHAFADLSREWEMFTLQLDCWRIEKGISNKRTAARPAIAPVAIAPPPEPEPPKTEPPKPRGSRKTKDAPATISLLAIPAPSVTPSQAGAVLRAVPRKRPRKTACSAQMVLPGILSLPFQLNFDLKEAA